jgi:hypothetical protein
MFALPQTRYRWLILGIHRQVKATEPFNGHDAALLEQGNHSANGIFGVQGLPVAVK